MSKPSPAVFWSTRLSKMVRLLLPALMLVAAVGSQVVFDESDRQDLAVLSQVNAESPGAAQPSFNDIAPEWPNVTPTKSAPKVLKKAAKAAKACKPGSKGKTKCGEICLCRADGKWKCCRFRFEMLSLVEHAPRLVKKWVLMLKKIRFHPLTYLAYRELMEAHRANFTTAINHLSLSMPWHRWFLLSLEKMMKLFDCRSNVPYLNLAKISGDFQTHFLWSGKVLGGQGNANIHNCVTSGPFVIQHWRLTPEGHSSCGLSGVSKCCLQRSMKLRGTRIPVADGSRIEALINIPPPQYPEFLAGLEALVLLPAHVNIAGTMATRDAAQAPEYSLLRAYADYIWWRYLRQSPTHRAAAVKFHGERILPWTASDDTTYPVVLATKVGGIKASEMVNAAAQGAEKVCVTYQWSHKPLKKKLSSAKVQALTADEEWKLFEGVASQASQATLLSIPGENQATYKNLAIGFELFKMPPAERKLILKAVQDLKPKSPAITASKLKSDEDRITGMELENVLG